MAISKRYEEKIEILPPFSSISVRTATIVEEDGVEIGRSYHRDMLNPGEDAGRMSSNVQSIASLLHTTELINSYNAALEEY